MCENQELVIRPEDLLWLIPEIAEMRSEQEIRPAVFPADNVGYFGRYEKALRDQGAQINFWIGCRAGCQVIGIESDGNVKGCLSLPSSKHGKDLFSEGSLREQSLPDRGTVPTRLLSTAIFASINSPVFARYAAIETSVGEAARGPRIATRKIVLTIPTVSIVKRSYTNGSIYWRTNSLLSKKFKRSRGSGMRRPRFCSTRSSIFATVHGKIARRLQSRPIHSANGNDSTFPATALSICSVFPYRSNHSRG
jgi:hypothetical protein